MKSFLEKLEANSKTHKPVVMAFGRMNPPTVGHEKLVNKVKDIAKDYNAPHHIILSHSSDAKKNPLDIATKVKHAKRFFPGSNIVSSSKEHPTFLQHAARLHQAGHDHLVMVGGSDRTDEFKKKLDQYNGTHPGALFNFKKIEVKSAGQRDPDAEGTEGMSASKMREHAKNNDLASFKQGVPAHVPEKHARELMNDVRKGMGIHESINHGLFKAIFVSGGPGSGKDLIIREAIAEQKAVEINSNLAISILNDKHKLSEQSRDTRKEAIRNRLPLIINGTTNEQYNILEIKEELEELGYETMMIFVNTSNDSSKSRNAGHARMMAESIRQERWEVTQLVAEKFNQEFSKYLEFDNSLDLNEADVFQKSEKEEDITIIYEMANWFFDTPVDNDIANSWLYRNKKYNVNKMFETFLEQPIKFKESYEKYVRKSKTNSKTIFAKEASCTCGSSTKGRTEIADNLCPSCQLVRNQGKQDSVRDGDVASNSGYTYKTYEEAQPTIITGSKPKETNFQQDADKAKAKKQGTTPANAGKALKVPGLGPEYDTRGSGTVYPTSGLGNVTYREQKENKYSNTAEVSHKSFNRFRKESMDSPSVEMGVTGGEYGPSKKEPMDTLNKIPVDAKKKKYVKF
jgi:predicted kinase